MALMDVLQWGSICHNLVEVQDWLMLITSHICYFWIHCISLLYWSYLPVYLQVCGLSWLGHSNFLLSERSQVEYFMVELLHVSFCIVFLVANRNVKLSIMAPLVSF